ncbi:alpha/beta fold hydrolase [Paracoccus aestuariivivens]|uniref:Alpha/beta fold hydrolase n=1 Tax=Paracoccus aestuariivivens TaxID=1820333 RepID=A0A6L6JCQ1_9RHOB|nr:alpha/beta hydrolase [Paracoccus aestuariivivens]MTH79276.1 alpha/beta fold hydrolase [Paracoccus aestuariivivens]
MNIQQISATTSPTEYLSINGRTLAYRTMGKGRPIILYHRFRGVMNLWDPAFLDALAGQGFQVIVFDYTGLGLSDGTPSYNPIDMAADARDLIAGLGLRDVVVGGWSLGGMAAQAALTLYPDHISHLVLLGTTPPGDLAKLAEQLFYDLAGKESYSIEDITALFLEPKSATSRAAAVRSQARIDDRHEELSPPVPVEFARPLLVHGPRSPAFPAEPVLQMLKSTQIPILHIGGDHDIIFPVENWYALNEVLPSVTLVTFPQAGHGPQHQHPQLAADIIASFVRNQ